MSRYGTTVLSTYDDNDYIVNNPLVTSGITLESLGKAFTQPHFFMWHPLTTISHMLDYQIFGLNPAGHHFVSVAIHIVNALLLFWILNNLGGTIWPSAFVAGGFRIASDAGGISGMGSGAENGIKRTVLAAYDGRIYSLCKTAGIRPVSVGVAGIRSLYYDQAGGCDSAICAAAAGLLAA